MRGKPDGLTYEMGSPPSSAAEAAPRSSGDRVGSGDGSPLGCSLKATTGPGIAGVSGPDGVSAPASVYSGATPAVDWGVRSCMAATATEATVALMTMATPKTRSLGRSDLEEVHVTGTPAGRSSSSGLSWSHGTCPW